MNINWNISKADGLTISSYAFSSVAKLIEGIRETGTVDFVVRHNTKTSLDIEISSPKDGGRHNFAVAYVPKGAEKFKFHTATVNNIFSGTSTVRHYFKITKTQGLQELKEYLSLVLEELKVNTDSVNANLILYRMPEFTV